jgi:TRAP-type mannitol/chloroaromatic compound transport system permease small subunit
MCLCGMLHMWTLFFMMPLLVTIVILTAEMIVLMLRQGHPSVAQRPA